MVILNSFEGAVVIMTIKKTNLKYFLLPLISALFIVSLITLVLFTFFNGNKALVDTKLSYVVPSSLNDFDSIKKVNEVSYFMEDYTNFYESFNDVLRTSDGYISTKNIFENNMFNTYVIKVDFDGNEIWSYKYESEGKDYRNNMVLLNDKVYFVSPIHGTLALNVNDGSVYKTNLSLKAYDIQLYDGNLLVIGYDRFSILDSELNVLKEKTSESMSNDSFVVSFDDFYVENGNYYILSTKKYNSDNSMTPVIYTFDNNLVLVEELSISCTSDNQYLYENGYYRDYFNFFKVGDDFYQIGGDFHKIDENGVDTLLVDYYKFDNNLYNGVLDILVFDEFYITLDVNYNMTYDSLFTIDSHAYLNVRNADFEIVEQYKVNDNFIQAYSAPESMNYVDSKIVVKWYDWATYESYISEFEFANDTEKCTVIEGTGSDVGDEIKCGEEEFYVIENDGVNVKMMGKYNLLVADGYERFILDEPYVVADLDGIYDYLFNLQSFKEKLSNGYVINDIHYDNNSEDGSYILYEVLLAKSFDYKTGTIVCDKKVSSCTADDLFFLAKEQGYFGDNTYFYIEEFGGEDGYSVIYFIPDESNSYYIFDEPVTTKDALLNEDVQEILELGYDFNFMKLDNGLVFGLEFYKSSYYAYVILEESFNTERELLKSPEVTEYFQSGYYYYESIKDDDGNFFGVVLRYSIEYRRSFIFENDYLNENELIRSEDVATYLDDGYLYVSYIRDSNNNYIGAQFNKYDDRTYNTIIFEETLSSSLIDLYNRDDVKALLDQGYMIYETKTANSSYSCSEYNKFCKYNYSYLVLVKYDAYEFVTVIVDDYVKTSTEILNNDLVQAKINEGYEYEKYLSSNYKKYVANDDGTASVSTSLHYFGVVLKKKTGVVSSDDSSVPSYIMEKYKPVVVRQDEIALGAHGGSTGQPEPYENGVLTSMQIWGYSTSEMYSGGFVDYEYYLDYPVNRYYHSYYNTLKNDGFNALDVDSITVSKINSIVKDVSGNELPLEEWLANAEPDEYYDIISGNPYYILGSIKEYLPEDYSWLWGTTYWLQTFIPGGDYSLGDMTSGMMLFVDTLGDLCSTSYCNVAIGAGLRPVVTMSLSSVEFNVYTEDDGNGKVVSSTNTATKGDIISFETIPNDGYVLKDVTITDSLGNEIIYTDNKFVMPAADVTISATFEKIILIEPTISIVPNRDRNNPLDENVSFYVTITNPYDIPLTDVKVTSDSDFTSCFINCSVLENNIVEIPVLEAGSSISYSIFYYVTEVGTIKANVEILSANAESPYFFNHEEPYVANTEASTIALVQVCNVLDGDGNGGVNQYNLISYDLYGTALLDYWFTLKDNTCVTLALETDITYNLYQLDRQEYKLISVEGLITSNEGSFILEPKEYNITFNNLYEKKNYFHSWNRVENDVIVNLDPS